MIAVKPLQVEPLDVLIRRYRRRTGLTQQQVAEQAGISPGGLRDLEQGRVLRPRQATLRALATALALSESEASLLLQSGRPSSGVRIQVLGPLAVLVDGVRVDLGSTTQRTLLGVLALSPSSVVSRDALIDVIWGEKPPPTAVELIQTHVSRLRRRLQPKRTHERLPRLVATAGGYQLLIDDEQLDLLAFRHLVTRARYTRDEGDLIVAGVRYREAVGLWRGQPLADLLVLDTHPAVTGLSREWQTAVLEYATVAASLGRHDLVVDHLQRLVEAEPLHEAAHARLMIALAGTGQQASALAVHDQIRRRLADDLGADPGHELSEAHRQVLRQEIARPEAAPVSAHRQLPPDIADFTGRRAELERVYEQVASVTEGATAVAISAIEGMAGVGKTRLALHLAHQLVAAAHYRDVQLYVDLHGHSEQPPADPSVVLASFLYLLGVPDSQLPQDMEARAALYRDQLHDKHALVVLDNAADEGQVRPLLPASPTNLVLVTSRRSLALDGARALPLDVFTPSDAHALLAQIAGSQRVAAEPSAAERVVDLCGRLPLAVALAARRLQTRPTWTLADLAARLQDAGSRVGELAAGSRHLRAVFDLSYQALAPDIRRLFRLLALHPGDDVTALSVAALADLTPAVARQHLDRLVDEHLITMASADRYWCHDLLHDYAAELTETEDADAARREAVERVLDYYLHTADRANQVYQPHRVRIDAIGTPPAHGPTLSTRGDAKRWLDAEQASLTSAVSLAAERGWPAHAWRLAHELRPILLLHGRLEDWERTHRIALAAARAADEPAGEAAILTSLGQAISNQRRSEEALEYLNRALVLHRQAGDRAGEAHTLGALGSAYAGLSRFPEALEHFRTALSLLAGQNPYGEAYLRSNIADLLVLYEEYDDALDNYNTALALVREIGDRTRETGVLANLGHAYRRLGRYDEAISYLDQALLVASEVGFARYEVCPRYCLGQTYRELGQRDQALAQLTEALDTVRTVGGEATECEILVDVGAVHRDAGDLGAAHDCLRLAFALAVETRDRYQEARTLDGLGHIHDRAGRNELAHEHWHQAKALFIELGTPEADQIRTRP